MNEKIPKLVEEYGDEKNEDIYTHILNAVISYTKYALLKIDDKKLAMFIEEVIIEVEEPIEEHSDEEQEEPSKTCVMI